MSVYKVFLVIILAFFTFEFTASGVLHHVAMYGKGNYNVEQLKVDMAKVVDACTRRIPQK